MSEKKNFRKNPKPRRFYLLILEHYFGFAFTRWRMEIPGRRPFAE